MKFSDKLAKMRKANNLSQEQLADQLGVTRQSVSKWESSDSYPDMAKIVQICKILNCTINDILDDDVVQAQSESNKKQETEPQKYNAIKKAYDELLTFITRTVNMVSHMGPLQIAKMLVELAVVALLLFLASNLVLYAVKEFLWAILNLAPQVHEIVEAIFTAVIGASAAILSIIILVHIYKIRYLDYYVTLTDNNVNEQSVEEPIEENRTELLQDNKQERIVIIRDPKHSGSKVIDGLINAVVFVSKLFIVLCILPVVFSALASAAGLIFCIIRSGAVFRSSILICAGALILSIAILMFFYDVLNNRALDHNRNIALLVGSLLIMGCGIGLLSDSITKLTITNHSTFDNLFYEEMVLESLTDDSCIIFESNDIRYIVDETCDNIWVQCQYPEATLLRVNNFNGEIGDYTYSAVYGLDYNDLYIIQLLLEDLSNNCVDRYYNGEEWLIVTITCNSQNKERLMKTNN